MGTFSPKWPQYQLRTPWHLNTELLIPFLVNLVLVNKNCFTMVTVYIPLGKSTDLHVLTKLKISILLTYIVIAM